MLESVHILSDVYLLYLIVAFNLSMNIVDFFEIICTPVIFMVNLGYLFVIRFSLVIGWIELIVLSSVIPYGKFICEMCVCIFTLEQSIHGIKPDCVFQFVNFLYIDLVAIKLWSNFPP